MKTENSVGTLAMRDQQSVGLPTEHFLARSPHWVWFVVKLGIDAYSG